MRYTWFGQTILLVTLFAGATSAQAQGMPGAPVFANEPQAAPGPEFCPGEAATIYRTPFDDNTPPFNGFVEPCSNGEGPRRTIYFGAGALALERQGLGNGLLGVADPSAGVLTQLDTGKLPPPNASTIVTNGTAGARYHWGAQAVAGLQVGSDSIEVSGFYLKDETDSGTVIAPGRIDLPFGQFVPPANFQGDRNIWSQADQVTVSLCAQLWGAEVNYRHVVWPGFELLAGVRYINQGETFDIFTDDDGQVFKPANPLFQATYESHVQNRIPGGQFGFEITQVLVPQWFSLGVSNKNMIGPNFIEAENTLIRGDGLIMDLGHVTKTTISGAVEVNAFATLWLGPNVRLSGGYQALWLFNVAEAHNQVIFDPNVPLTSINRSDSIFYHGPRLELQIAF